MLVLLGDSWPEAPDVRLTITSAEWKGIGDGYGHLQARRVVVESGGRRGRPASTRRAVVARRGRRRRRDRRTGHRSPAEGVMTAVRTLVVARS